MLLPKKHSEIEVLQEQGWIKISGLLSKTTIKRLHTAWERIEPIRPSSGNNWGPRDLHQEKELCEIVEDLRVLTAVRALLHAEPYLKTCNGRSPPVGLGRQGLHADWHTPVKQSLFVNVFFALDDMDKENGATRVVPESHRWYRLPKGHFAQPQGRHPKEISLSGTAGDAFVFSAHLWHAGDQNRSGKRRRVIIAQYSGPHL